MTNLYLHSEVVHNFKAPAEVVPILIQLLNPRSVLDVGCGLGTWLKVFETKGIVDYIGTDGEYVDRSLLKIPVEKFFSADLTSDWSFHRMFDLVMCLEVAEHLPSQFADHLVAKLVEHGDTILFSAATPGQGGQHHVNEQWPEYWQEKFRKHGFHFHDTLRPLIWNNAEVDWWYRQNIFLVTRTPNTIAVLSAVHPQHFLEKVNGLTQNLEDIHTGKIGIQAAWQILRKAVIRFFRKVLRS